MLYFANNKVTVQHLKKASESIRFFTSVYPNEIYEINKLRHFFSPSDVALMVQRLELKEIVECTISI